MIKYVLYDDNPETFTPTSKSINKIMMKYECDYRIEKFEKYSKELEEIINQKDVLKIYLLDIEVPKVDGMNLASKIRENDWNSIIIFLTAHEDFRLNAFSERLMILDYICKKEKYQEQLEKCLNIAMEALEQNTKILKYKFNSVSYRIPLNEILYVTKVPLNKKCRIFTIGGEKYEIGGNIEKVCNKLGKGFKQSNKSCIVNIENIKTIDTCNNIITFINGKSIDSLSTRMKKGFEEYVMNYKS